LATSRGEVVNSVNAMIGRNKEILFYSGKEAVAKVKK